MFSRNKSIRKNLKKRIDEVLKMRAHHKLTEGEPLYMGKLYLLETGVIKNYADLFGPPNFNRKDVLFALD
jgi:hypothetical protein